MGAGNELTGYGASFALSLVSLAFVCLMAYAILRWLGRKGWGGDPGHLLKVRARCHLEPRRAVYLVEAAGRCFLLGVGDGPVTLLAEVDRATIPAEGAEGEGGSGSSFADLLGKLSRRRGR